MTTEEAINYYGDRKTLAKELDIWPTATYNWGERPPMATQYELHVKTHGELTADGYETSTPA